MFLLDVDVSSDDSGTWVRVDAPFVRVRMGFPASPGDRVTVTDRAVSKLSAWWAPKMLKGSRL